MNDFKIKQLPDYLQYVALSLEYGDCITALYKRYNIPSEKQSILDDLIWDIWAKKVDPHNLIEPCETTLGLSKADAAGLAKEIVLNMVLVFPMYFGDQTNLYTSMGGKLEDVNKSITFVALLRFMNEVIADVVQDASIKDTETEAVSMKNLFQKELADLLYVPDGTYRQMLNNRLVALIQQVDELPKDLLEALYLNTQLIGRKKISVGGSMQEPSIANWLKDFLEQSGGVFSSVAIARYLSQNANMKDLVAEDKKALQQLLEIYTFFKNYPQGVGSQPPSEWVIIPFEVEVSALAVVKEPDLDEEVVAPLQTIPSPQAINYEILAGMAAKQAGVTLADEVLSKRLVSILVSRIKGIRDAIETREMLMGDAKTSGVGLSKDQAIALVKAADTYIDMIKKGTVPKEAIIVHQAPVIETAELPAVVANPSSLPMAATKQSAPQTVKVPQAPAKPVEKTSVVGRMRSNTSVGAAPIKQIPKASVPLPKPPQPAGQPTFAIEEVDGIPMIVEKTATSAGVIIPPPVKKAVQNNEASRFVQPVRRGNASNNAPRELPVLQRASQASPHKINVSDVKMSPRLTDPIEELRTTTLKDFRRMSGDPMAAVKRIYQKIKLLEGESMQKKVAAITAWHQSEVHNLYTEIGKESFGSGVNIDAILSKRASDGRQTLSEKEFDALMELNEMLRF